MSDNRVEQWKRNLLDLSMRNPLLNAREGRKFLPIKQGGIYSNAENETAVVPYSPPETDGKMSIESELTEKELKKRLKELYTTSRSMYNESGINSLFLAVGFLNWKENDSDEIRHAPLLLVPAELIRQNAAPGYKLQRTDEDAVVNFCLVEMLRSQFGLEVGDIAGGGMGDGDPDFNEVFKAFANTVKDKKEWSISTSVALGIFSFSKIVIWRDLTDHIEEFKKHPFVAHLADGSGLYDDKIHVFPQEEVERHIAPEKLYCPMSADSSQLAAVLYSATGKSFVLHGPPGTGKSQTITNIIAHNLALGKRVLFVSEKKAALDVVYKRLSQCGLGPFCLEIHSSKADKANVMKQFAEAMAIEPPASSRQWQSMASNVVSSFSEIGAYVKDLHRPATNGLTAYDCLARHGAKHSAAEASLIELDASSSTHENLVELGKVVQGLADEWKSVDHEAYDALKYVRTKDWTPDFQSKVIEQAEAFIKALEVEGAFKRNALLFWNAVKAAANGTISFPLFSGSIDDMRVKMQSILSHIDAMRLVLSYRVNRRTAERAKCARFVEALEAGRFPVEEAQQVFEDSCAEKTLNTLISRSRILSGFSGIKQEERIARFKELDEKYIDLVKGKLVSILSKRVYEVEHPPAVKKSDGTIAAAEIDPETKKALALLKREAEKKKRFMAPRKLLAETKSVATKLKPCFLMSPLSVAQYLPADSEAFDLVVFDEASQMTVWDVVGVIARGKQFIVVGDPKQLPPTNFFMKGDVAEDEQTDENQLADLESVLDECLASGMHSAHLNWHYRSRHEALIAFSNRHYYDDRLNTFPSPENNDRLGVSFRYVDGALYEHKSHTNPGEAEAVVDYLFERLADPKERKRSWGIVTFNVSQQRLIEELIDERAEDCEWAPEFFDDSKPDAFFVKNLENVQGDERDVIMFSIAYAPDAQGRFAMSFGPVNRVGGERRLNVAITRAREQVVVFAAVHSADIHSERTNSIGVKHLKALMEYAEKGYLEGVEQKCESCEVTGVKKRVCDCLKANGYEFELDYGMSSYPIDIAVRDPKNPDRFILGIECDGSRYAAQATVRDRDVLRPSVLSNLGWKTFRAWSVDWALDRKRAEERLLENLKMT